MHRRTLLKGAAAAAMTAPWLRVPGAAAVDNGVFPRQAWVPVGSTPALVFPQTSDTNTQRMFPSLLPAGRFLPGAIDQWYLWLWTHDSSRIHLYTAPAPGGPWTSPGYGTPPTPYPAGYVSGHFSSGDIVWDPGGSRFISTPHGLRIGTVAGNGEACQDSFLIESTDGLTWHWLDGDNSPRLLCGPPGSVDSVHTGYGRLLRDLDGDLYRFQNKVWWLYRAQRHDTTGPTQYQPRLVSAPSLAGPFTAKQAAYPSGSGGLGLFDVGCFLRGGGQHHSLYAEGSPLAAPTTAYSNTTGADDMNWLPRSAMAVAAPPSAGAALAGGLNVSRDPSTGRQYAAQMAINSGANQHELWIYQGNPA